MLCCTLLVAAQLASAEPFFATPMFLRGQPVWVTPVSRRQLLLNYAKSNDNQPEPPQEHIEVAEALV